MPKVENSQCRRLLRRQTSAAGEHALKQQLVIAKGGLVSFCLSYLHSKLVHKDFSKGEVKSKEAAHGAGNG